MCRCSHHKEKEKVAWGHGFVVSLSISIVFRYVITIVTRTVCVERDPRDCSLSGSLSFRSDRQGDSFSNTTSPALVLRSSKIQHPIFEITFCVHCVYKESDRRWHVPVLWHTSYSGIGINDSFPKIGLLSTITTWVLMSHSLSSKWFQVLSGHTSSTSFRECILFNHN